MADIKYVGSSVNSAVNQLTSVSGRFQPVANDVRTHVDTRSRLKIIYFLENYFKHSPQGTSLVV